MFVGYGYAPYFVEGSDPMSMHQAMAATLDHCVAEIRRIKQEAAQGNTRRPLWPMIVFRTPKGWTAPREIDGKLVEGFWRSHQVPLAGVRSNPEHLSLLESWMRSYRPEELFDESGHPRADFSHLVPPRHRRMSDTPHAKERFLNRQIACLNYAHQHGTDDPAAANWRWNR